MDGRESVSNVPLLGRVIKKVQQHTPIDVGNFVPFGAHHSCSAYRLTYTNLLETLKG